MPDTALTSFAVIDSRADLLSAMAEISALTATEAAVQARTQARMQRITQQQQAALLLMVDDRETSIPERLAELRAAVQDYAQQHRDELLPPNRKSVRLPHGEIGWRKGRESIVEDADHLTRLAELLEYLTGKLMAIAKKVRVGIKSYGLDRYFRVKLTPNYPALLDAYRAGDLTDGKLAAMGLRHQPADETFWIEPLAPQATDPIEINPLDDVDEDE